MAITLGPCTPYLTPEELLKCCCPVLLTPEGDLIPEAEELLRCASEMLWQLTGRKFKGICEDTVRPCRDECVDIACECCEVDKLPLRAPICDIVEVKIDGMPLADTSYKIMDDCYLVPVGMTWPGCQNLLADDTEMGTFSIRYTYGTEPPKLFKDAVAELVCELAKSCKKYADARCKLPTNTVSVTGQGVTVRMDPDVYAAASRLEWVSQAIAVWCPDGYQPGGIWSPDTPDGWSYHRFR